MSKRFPTHKTQTATPAPGGANKMVKRQIKKKPQIALVDDRNSGSSSTKITRADQLAVGMLRVLNTKSDELTQVATDVAIELSASPVFDEVLGKILREIRTNAHNEERVKIELLHFAAAIDIAQRTPITC